MTLPKSSVNSDATGTALELTVLLKSVLKDSDDSTASEYWNDANGFEQWCRDQGLLIEINDADYAEPKLAVIS